MKTLLFSLLILVTATVGAGQDKAARSVGHPQHAVRVSQGEWAAFEKKMEAFRKSLSDKERQIFDSLIPGRAPGEQPEEAHQPGDRDSVGATKVNGKQIRESNGSLVNCPEGTSVQAVPNGQPGASGFNWLCVSSGA
jgi:hypothetical protein